MLREIQIEKESVDRLISLCFTRGWFASLVPALCKRRACVFCRGGRKGGEISGVGGIGGIIRSRFIGMIRAAVCSPLIGRVGFESPASRVFILLGIVTPGSASLHPGLELSRPLRGLFGDPDKLG